MIEYQAQRVEDTDPYTMFIYAIKSPYTKESYFRRLRRFFDAIDLCKDMEMEQHFLVCVFLHSFPNSYMTSFLNLDNAFAVLQ